MRLYVLITLRSCGSVSTPGVAVWRLNAGIAKNTSNPPAATTETTGWRRTGFRIRDHAPLSLTFHFLLER